MRLLMLIAALLALALAFPAAAQGRVTTETIVPKGQAADDSGKRAPADDALPEIVRDPSLLPDAVRAMRERILEAARSGELDKLVAVMRSNRQMPLFSFGGEDDPIEYWRSSYPDSDGIEVLAILIGILEMPFVHLDNGTPQEMYVWPYFYAMPLERLTPQQMVELFRLVTGSDWRELREFGAYIFYRVGISPDGTWHFFIAGD